MPQNQTHDSDRASASAPSAGRLTEPALVTRFLTIGGGGLWAYLCCVAVFGRSLAGGSIGLLGTAIAIIVGVLAIRTSGVTLLSRSPGRTAAVLSTALFSTATLMGLAAADVAYAAFVNRTAGREGRALDPGAREADGTMWHGELFPRRYYPTDDAFFVYKPNTTITADTRGEFYHPDMLSFPLLADSVLELKRLTYTIGPHGLRSLEPLSESRIIGLGDSFAMGYGTDQDETWTTLLGYTLGEPVFNAGVSSTGPAQHLQLLEHLFETQPDSMHVEDVLWMIFEGNDLENSYASRHAELRSAARGPIEGTWLDTVLGIPWAVQRGSVLVHAADAVARSKSGVPSPGSPLEIRGLKMPYLLYRSDRWGYRLFNPLDVDRATRPRDYVDSHQNLPALTQTIADMAALGRTHGFDITVVLAPTAARVHGPSFIGFPTISERPHFLEIVTDLARAAGLEVLDLYPALSLHAAEELLYYRDDHHWNVRGNALVAELIAGRFEP